MGFVLYLSTIASLNLIHFIGAPFDPPSRSWIGYLTVFMDICLVASGFGLGPTFLCQGRFLPGALFLVNPFIMAIAFALRFSGQELHRAILFGFDLYWLNLYLIEMCLGGKPQLENTPFIHPMKSQRP